MSGIPNHLAPTGISAEALRKQNEILWRSALELDPKQRLRRQGLRGTLIIIRQSSLPQATNNLGSQDMQRERTLGQAFTLGIPHESITIAELLGEQATVAEDRALFSRCLDLIRARRVGLVIAPMIHRLTRNNQDSVNLVTTLREAGTLLLVNDAILDAGTPEGEAAIIKDGADARRDVASTAKWRTGSSLALARKGAMFRMLPTGLVWADPLNPAYRRACEKAGLLHWLPGSSTAKTCARLDHTDYYVLPFPDASVHAAVACTVAWFFETGSVHAVVARIRDGFPGWPSERAGLMPSTKIVRWRPAHRATWSTARATTVERLLVNPAIFGIYRVYIASEAHPALRTLAAKQRKGAHTARALERKRPPMSSVFTLVCGSERAAHSQCA